MLTAGTTLGPYRIVGALGAGGMGEVYRAHDPRLGRNVAIKVLPPRSAFSPDARARFEREARTISQLSHPHICALHDIGREGETDYLVMELLEGETLAHRIARGPLPVADVLKLGAEIASALDRAHAAGVVHRDLKPGNVMLTKSGAKLMDFGLARVSATPASGAALSVSPTMTQPLTGEGAIVGTFQYMAPEQLEGKDADARSDIWALGCVLYEMATGRHAFAGESQASLIGAIMRDEPRSIAELQPLTPPALGHVVARCLAKDPADRWQSARDVAIGLEMARGASGVQPETRAQIARAKGRPRPGQLLAGALAGSLLIGALWTVVARRTHVTNPARVTYKRLTLRRGFVSRARFSPDGKTVFYTANWDGQLPELFETRPGFPTSRSLGLPGTQLLAMSRDGTMALLIGQTGAVIGWGTLAEVPMSGGAPRRIADNICQAEWAPDGKTLLITHQVGGKVRMEMPPGHVIYQTAGDVFSPRVSPDGKRIAFVDTPFSYQVDNRGSFVIADTAGNIITRTAEWACPGYVMWSPDGHEAWFSGTQDYMSTDIRALSITGTERVVARLDGWVTLLDLEADGQALIRRSSVVTGIRGRAASAGEEHDLSWFDESFALDLSRDGRTLLFQEAGLFGGPQYAVCLRGMDGSPPIRLGPGNSPSLSPEGRWAASIMLATPQRLILLPTGSGDTTSLPRGPIERYYDTGWLPDGASVVFAGSEPGHAQRSYVQAIAGGPPRPVTPEGMAGTRVSPDGRMLAAVSRDWRLFVCSLTGDSARFVAPLLPMEEVIQWGADGRSIYVGAQGTSESVCRLDIATGRRSPWKRFSLADSAGATIWNVRLTPDARSYAYTYIRNLSDLYLVTGLK